MPAKYTDYRFCNEYLIKSDIGECREIDIAHNLKIADMLSSKDAKILDVGCEGGFTPTPIEDFNVVSIRGTPEIDIDKYELSIEGLVENPFTLRYSDLLSYPAKTKIIMLRCVEGWSGVGEWTGIPLRNILEEAKIRYNARTVVFYSKDGYSTSLSVEDSLRDNVMLSYKVNGQALPKEHGYPLRLVVEDKYGYKWIKWITHIEVIKGTYKGYWESYGYNNKADVGGPKKEKMYTFRRVYKKLNETFI